MRADAHRRHAREAVPAGILWILASLAGLGAGLGAIVLRGLIALFHNLFFLGRFSFSYDANLHTSPGPWGPWVILAPVLGAAAVAFLVTRFAPEAKGHGVPEVMDAIYYGRGIIRPVVAAVKAVASAISIGSGGSVGREGPIIQIAAAFSSTVGQLLRIPAWQRVTLIAAGGAGGIAATFNTPLGGVLFAAELLLHEVSVRTLVPVALSSAAATTVGRLAFGVGPSFSIPALEQPYFRATNPIELPAYLVLGLLVGGASALFIRSLYAAEDFFERRVPGGYFSRHIAAMALVGVGMYGFLRLGGHYFVAGIGYATVQDVLTGRLTASAFLLLLFVCKLLATCLTLGSGGSGGVFSPALFMGSTLGGAFGTLLLRAFPQFDLVPTGFAVVGMAGMVAGTTGASTTALLMIFEMTRDYSVVVPMTLTVAVSYGVRRLLVRESIYTMKLARRGHPVPEALQADISSTKSARDLKRPHVTLLPGALSLAEAKAHLGPVATELCLAVVEGGRIRGVLSQAGLCCALAQAPGNTKLAEVAHPRFQIIGERTELVEILRAVRSKRVEVFLVSVGSTDSPDAITGWISKEHVTDSMAESLGLLAD